MKGAIMGLLAETNLHPGAGQSTGGVDLPVAREAATGYPVVVGSSLKGALRERAETDQAGGLDADVIFGTPKEAGSLSFTDACLLLLPVRSLTGHFKWLTCPYLLERYSRDRELAGYPVEKLEIPRPSAGQAIMSAGEGQLFLEELSCEIVVEDLSMLAAVLQPLIRYPSVRQRLAAGLAVIADEEFAYFARYGLPVSAHNVLNKETKISENLWYEETLPADCLLYALVFARFDANSALDGLRRLFSVRPYLQLGGNETVGQGWCAVEWLAKEDA